MPQSAHATLPAASQLVAGRASLSAANCGQIGIASLLLLRKGSSDVLTSTNGRLKEGEHSFESRLKFLNLQKISST